jgi:hypothetical protein
MRSALSHPHKYLYHPTLFKKSWQLTESVSQSVGLNQKIDNKFAFVNRLAANIRITNNLYMELL